MGKNYHFNKSWAKVTLYCKKETKVKTNAKAKLTFHFLGIKILFKQKVRIAKVPLYTKGLDV